ncbi:hypothetical protein HY382_03065 [Candidatus Curtissbacteria bacterium]|nr:hypothetical protein [Candidatus Curtissbacteria bacterium]
MKKLFVGVDGGASKTSAMLLDGSGKVLAESFSGGSNASVFGLKKSFASIENAVKEITKNIKSDAEVFGCFAIAGVDTQGQKKDWEKLIKSNVYFLKLFSDMPMVVNDTLAAMRSGTGEKDAIVVISGTGSNCLGRNKAGKFAKAGGLDYLLSDEGSGYFIGSLILKAIIKSLDGRGEKTALSGLFQKAFRVKSLDEIVHLVYLKPWGKVEVATTAKLLEQAIEIKDNVAARIAGRAAWELNEMIKAVAVKLGFGKRDRFTVVKSGSVFENIYISKLLDKLVKADFANALCVRPEVSAAHGAAQLAYEAFS